MLLCSYLLKNCEKKKKKNAVNWNYWNCAKNVVKKFCKGLLRIFLLKSIPFTVARSSHACLVRIDSITATLVEIFFQVRFSRSNHQRCSLKKVYASDLVCNLESWKKNHPWFRNCAHSLGRNQGTTSFRAIKLIFVKRILQRIRSNH